MTLVSAPTIDESAGRTNLNTRPTRDTGAFAEWNSCIRDKDGAGTAFLKTKGVVTNELTARTHTSPAEDTTVILENDKRVGGINRIRLPVWLKRPMGHSFSVGCILQFTISATHLAIGAEVIPFTEDQGQHKLSCVQHLLRVRLNHHVIANRQCTRRLQCTIPFYFHEAKTTSSIRRQMGMVAQCRNVDSGALCRAKNGCPFRNFQ